MEITLVCSSGITTSILATKLNTYTKEQSYNDFFIATRISSDLDFLFANSDLMLIAPQVKGSVEKIKLEAKQRNIPLIFLNEEDLVFGNVEKIYQEINQYRQGSKKSKVKIVLTIQGILRIYMCACIKFLPFTILVIFFVTFSIVFRLGSEDVFISFLPFTLAFAIGHEYGRFIKEQPLSNGLLFLVSSSFILEIDYIQVIGEGITGLREGHLILMTSELEVYFLVLLISLLTLLVAHLTRNIIFNSKLRESQVVRNFLEPPLINGIVYAVMLVFRLVFL